MLSNEDRIKSTIKRLLKVQGANYSMLADALGVSLPTVRRILTSDSLSIDRVTKICEYLKITFPELVKLSFREQKAAEPLTEEQEKYFVKHPDAYSVLRYLGRDPGLAGLAHHFDLTPKRLQVYLHQLEFMKLIQVQKGQIVRLLIRWPAPWRKNGPLFMKYGRDIYWRAVDHFYERTIKNGGVFNEGFYFFLDAILLSETTYQDYVRDIQQLKDKYHHLSQIEQKTFPPAELKVVNALLGVDQVDLLTKVMGAPK